MIFSFAKSHKPFCGIKPSISKMFNSLWYSFLVILSFSPSILQFFVPLAGTHPSWEFELISSFCQILWCPSVPAYSNSPALVPFFCLAYPEHFLHQINTSPCLSILLNQLWPPWWRTLRFPKLVDKKFCPIHLPGIFMYLLPLPHLIHRYMSASAHHSVRCFIPSLFLSMNINCSFGLGLSSSQSFHSSTIKRKATYTSSLSCFTTSALASANSSAFSLPSVTNFQNPSSFLFLSSCGVPSNVPLPPRCLFLQIHVVLPNSSSTSLHLRLLA